MPVIKNFEGAKVVSRNAKGNQNIFDLAICKYGCIEGVMNIIHDNKDSVDVMQVIADTSLKNYSWNVLVKQNNQAYAPLIQEVTPAITEKNIPTSKYFKDKQIEVVSWEGLKPS